MGFAKPDLQGAEMAIRKACAEIRSPYNDGYTCAYLKLEVYQLKCILEDLYENLPTFGDEAEWEKIRMVEILKRKNNGSST